MPDAAITDCSHSGRCDEEVEHWSNTIQRPESCTVRALQEELKEYGAWNQEELADDAANWRRIVWLAAGNIKEEMAIA